MRMTRRWLALVLCASWGLLGAWTSQNDTVTVLSGRVVTASADLTTMQVGGVRDGICMLTVTASSGTPNLTIYLQSVVGGVDDDYCSFIPVTGTGSTVLRWSVRNGPSIVSPNSQAVADRTFTAGNCRLGPSGDRLKVAALMTGGTPSMTITLTCNLGRD